MDGSSNNHFNKHYFILLRSVYNYLYPCSNCQFHVLLLPLRKKKGAGNCKEQDANNRKILMRKPTVQDQPLTHPFSPPGSTCSKTYILTTSSMRKFRRNANHSMRVASVLRANIVSNYIFMKAQINAEESWTSCKTSQNC